MKNIIALIISLSLFSCSGSNEGENKQEPEEKVIQIPENAVSFSFQDEILIRMRINDSINGNFIFDTGSDQLYLDSLFVENNNIPIQKTRKKKIRGVGLNTPMVHVSDGIKLEIDSMSKIFNHVPIVNLRGLSGVDVAGVFGTDFFENSVLRINFDSSYFQIIKSSEFVVPNGYDTLKLFLVENKTIIKCEALIIDSLNVEGWAILDLGSAYSLTFTSVIANEFDFSSKIQNKYVQINKGYGGESHSYFFRAKKLKIGKYTLNSPVMNYSTDKKGALSMWGILGLLGTKVMKRFDLVFDFPNKILYLKPNSLFEEHFSSNSTGFTGKLNQSDSLAVFIIENVLENSAAQHAGIKTGDTITHLNGLKISSYSKSERKGLFQQDTIELELKIKRNTELIEIKYLPQEIL
jgi:hypothetical protein